MPGPLVHRAAMRQCIKLLKQINVPVSVGKLRDNIEPDKGDTHGFDFFGNREGNLIDKIEKQYEIIKDSIKRCDKDLKNIDRESFDRAVRFLCHYITDAHTIGQISSDLWGDIDTGYDICCDFIVNKRKYPVKLLDFESKESIRDSLYDSMKSVHITYHTPAKIRLFMVSSHIKRMTRNAVKCGGEYAAAYVRLALKG